MKEEDEDEVWFEDELEDALEDSRTLEFDFGIEPIGIRPTARLPAKKLGSSLPELITFPLDRDYGPLLIAHELAHQKLGHIRASHKDPTIKQEEDAWRLASRWLKRSHEWTPEARVLAAENLGSYYEGISKLSQEEAFQKALDFMEKL